MIKTAIESNLGHISFHTPGHSGGVCFAGNTGGALWMDARYDVTELSYTDNLLSPIGELGELETRAAERFGAEDLLLFTNGATGAVFAAIASVEGKLAILGDAHVSVVNALTLMKKKAVFCKDADAFEEYSARVKTGDAEAVSAVFVTSPDYLGRNFDLVRIASRLRVEKIPLIVDAAHGSHFAFCDKLPIRATEYGDLAIYSLHKTLPVLTGGAALAVKSEYSDAAREARRLTHSTSPSYPVLLSIEEMLARSDGFQKAYEETIALIESFKTDIASTSFSAIENDDPTRLVIASPYSGQAVAERLEERGVFAEYAAENYVVLIVTSFNRQYLAYLAEIFKKIGELSLYHETLKPAKGFEIKEFSPIECLKEVVPIERSVGRIAAAPVGLYPPGVPILFPGDEIDEKTAEFLQNSRSRLFGLARKGVVVVK